MCVCVCVCVLFFYCNCSAQYMMLLTDIHLLQLLQAFLLDGIFWNYLYNIFVCISFLTVFALMISSIGKSPSPILARDSVKIEYVSGGQFSSYELAFGLELGPNPHPHFKMVSKSILDSSKGPSTMLSMHQAQKCWEWGGVLGKTQVPHWLEIVPRYNI